MPHYMVSDLGMHCLPMTLSRFSYKKELTNIGCPFPFDIDIGIQIQAKYIEGKLFKCEKSRLDHM